MQREFFVAIAPVRITLVVVFSLYHMLASPKHILICTYNIKQHVSNVYYLILYNVILTVCKVIFIRFQRIDNANCAIICITNFFVAIQLEVCIPQKHIEMKGFHLSSFLPRIDKKL